MPPLTARRPPDRRSGLGRDPAGWALLLALGLLVLAGHHGVLSSCGPGLHTPGVTVPQGDIILLEGDLLELYCVLNLTHPATKGRNASHLAFYRQNKTIGPEYLHVVNETTLKLSMRPNVSSSMYYCKLNAWADAEEEVVCLNNVAVGYLPQNVTDFHCVSQNWQNLTCSWKKQPNPVKTRYTIWFRLGGKVTRGSKFGCPEDTDIQEDRCVWSETSNPPYRQPYETYLFSIEGVNHFNKSVFYHKFNHFAHVIPAKPENLKVREKTAYSVFLEWSLPYPLQNFPTGLIQRIEYLPQWESRESWHSVDMSGINLKQSKFEWNVTSLKYPNTLYDIRVYMKSAKANPKDNSVWSAPAAVTVKTKPDLPGAPPKTDIGSFEIFSHVESRDVYVHWQTIPDYLQNGDKFSYKIIDFEEDGSNKPVEPVELNKKYAKFTKLDLDKNFRLSIVSVNTEGQSVNKSEIHIPSRLQVPPGPTSVTKVFYENGTYELSWKPPTSEEENIESYTIFWCDSLADHTCTGYLNWTHVPSNITIKNMTVEDDKPYQFAVSANTHNASSGMMWASCTILYNKPIQKMKNVWVKNVGSTFMELFWNLDCVDRNGLVVGFRIYYCPVQHRGPECKSPNQNVTVENPQESVTNLTGLRPYTTYSISISVLSSAGESLPSDPLYNVTSEAAPSPPQNVSIVDITNTTITITWNAPEEKNGVIRKYEIHCDGKVQTKENDNNKEQKLVLENLTSYHNYSISVAACTSACSDKSPPLIAETKVGEPGTVNAPHVTFLNQSLLSVNWDPPVRPSGLLDYYEVNIFHPDGENSTIEVTYDTSLSKEIEGCSERQNHPYAFYVRAVNVDPNTGRKFKGKWSKPGEGSCYTNDLPQYLKIIIYVLMISLVIFVSCVLMCLGKRVWYKCKDMRDVEVKLPPGIVLPLETGRDQDFKMHQWVNHNHDSKPPHGLCPAADEERLLQQKDDHHHDRNLSGDSSGCSSGHESVASSATSGTRISSDSGTEVDRNEPGFGEPSWEAGSDSGSVGHRSQRPATKCPMWDEPYACVGAGGGAGNGDSGGSKSVRSTPNLTELDPGYAVLSLGSWPSTSSIPDRADKPLHPSPAPPLVPPLARVVPVGYVSLDAASALAPPPQQAKQGFALPPQDLGQQAKQGYVAHPPSSLLWDPPESPIPKGYVKTGRKETAVPAFTPEYEGSWDRPFGDLQRLQSPPQPLAAQGPAGPQSSATGSVGYVRAGKCEVRPSRTEPALGSGYVSAVAASGLLRDRQHKPTQAKQAHEYVLTGERQATSDRDPPLVLLDAEPPKAYCRVSERDVLVRPLASSSGYVPHSASSSRVIE